MADGTIILDNCENLWAEQVTIPNGSNVAPAISTQGRALVAILMPAAWTTAQLGFNAGYLPGSLSTVYNNAGGFEQATGEASAFIVFPSPDAIYAPYLQVKSVDASNVAVNQAADRVLVLFFRRFLGGA